MRWYVNEASLQEQFASPAQFEAAMRELVAVRARFPRLRDSLYAASRFSEALAVPGVPVRSVFQRCTDRTLKNAVLNWITRAGPFIENDRTEETDDYFECLGFDVTDGGIGEAARRIRAAQEAAAFSWPGGKCDFAVTPLLVDHGLAEDRLGVCKVDNAWSAEVLSAGALDAREPVRSWAELVEVVRVRFPRLMVADGVLANEALSREPFASVISNRVIALLSHLDTYMAGRNADGSEGPVSQEIVGKFFVGDRALFSGESASNQQSFRKELTFVDPLDEGNAIFAHWHGKISHRYFRIHFEWPVPATQSVLKILYLGPKITKS